MKRCILAVAVAFFVLAPIYAVPHFSQSSTADDRTQWLATILKEMQTIKVGMKRIDLLKVFKEEGGISTRLSRRYAYRDCPYIKVDVEFEPIGRPDNSGKSSLESSQDKIIRISKPFLDWPTYD